MLRIFPQCMIRVVTRCSRASAPVRAISTGFSGVLGRGAFAGCRDALNVPGGVLPIFQTPRRWIAEVAKPQLSPEAVQERVLTVCRNFDKLTKDKLSLESNFMNDLGLDSLDHVELVMAFEDEFGYEISDTDGEKLLRPSDVIKFVIQKQSSSSTSGKPW